MKNETCGKCRHFVAWQRDNSEAKQSSVPNGVCVSPRPMLGPEPPREVYSNAIKICPMWSAPRLDRDGAR